MIDYYHGLRTDMKFAIPESASRVLEIGCGEGNFIHHFDESVEYWGVEPDMCSAKAAQAKISTVYIGSFDEAFPSLPRSYFDLIICNDVIEHMIDERCFLDNLKELLVDDQSRIIGSVPNVRYVVNVKNFLFGKDWEYVENGILDKTHLRFFTIKSISKLFFSRGFDVEILQGINEYRPIGMLRRFVSLFMYILFGGDLKYFQIAFRIRPKQN